MSKARVIAKIQARQGTEPASAWLPGARRATLKLYSNGRITMTESSRRERKVNHSLPAADRAPEALRTWCEVNQWTPLGSTDD